MTFYGSKPEAPRPPWPDGPWGNNALLENVGSLTIFGIARSYDGAAEPHLCAPPMGTMLSYGEQHLCSPSDASPRCSADRSFVYRRTLPLEDVESVPLFLRDQ